MLPVLICAAAFKSGILNFDEGALRMKIYIIRHGETDYNLSGRMQGRLDVPLNDFGIKMARKTGKALSGIKFDAAYSSPLVRAKETARLVLEESGNGNVDIITDKRLEEADLGDWEGKQVKKGRCEIDIEQKELFFENPFKLGRIPNGESALEVCARTQEFITEISKREHEAVLVSTHGFAMRALLNFLYEDKTDFWQGSVPDNCSVNILSVENKSLLLLERDKIYYDKKSLLEPYK